MTGPVPTGTLTIDPADVPWLALLLREAARSISHRHRIPREVRDLLAAADAAVQEATCAAAVPPGSDLGDGSGPWSDGLTAREAGAVLGLTSGYVRRWCRDGRLPAHRMGPLWIVDRDAVAALALQRRSAA